MIKEIYGNYNFWSWLKYWYIDTMCKQIVIMADKTKIIHHKDEKCKKMCQSKRRENAPIDPERAALIEENRLAGEEMARQLEALYAKKEAPKELTDEQFINEMNKE